MDFPNKCWVKKIPIDNQRVTNNIKKVLYLSLLGRYDF